MSNEIATDFTPASPDTGPESLGAWFAKARIRRGLDSYEVARHLKLSPTIVEALEADHFSQIGPPVFVRGYLSRYARLLELPEPTVLERFRQQTASSHSPPQLKVVHPLRRQARARDLRGLVYLALLMGFGWTAIQHLPDLDPGRLAAWWSSDRAGGRKPVAQGSANATSQVHYPFQSGPAETTEVVKVTTPAHEAPPAAATEPAPATASAPPSVVFTTTAAQPDPVTAVSGPQTVPASPVPFTAQTSDVGPAANGEAKLLLEFSNDCWVEIKDAQGNVLASGLMRGNTTHTLSGPAPFKVTLGNAPAARIVLDDRLVDTTIYVPRRGTVSRFTLDRE